MTATVREIDGQMVLDDPEALAIIRVIAKRNCLITLKAQKDRVEHFKQRIVQRGLTAKEVVITLIHVDSLYGADVAELLMPGFDWAAVRATGAQPFARGLAERTGMQALLERLDLDASKALETVAGVAVIVMDYDTVEVFTAEFRYPMSTVQDLNDATEMLNDLLGAAEMAFRSMQYGVSASVELEGPNKMGEYTSLQFTKRGGNWELLINDAPIATASRAKRVLAAGKLVELGEALRLQTDRQLIDVRNAITQCEAFLAMVKIHHVTQDPMGQLLRESNNLGLPPCDSGETR